MFWQDDDYKVLKNIINSKDVDDDDDYIQINFKEYL
jgi:hypothetical protein